jgi:hypothetical protein
VAQRVYREHVGLRGKEKTDDFTGAKADRRDFRNTGRKGEAGNIWMRWLRHSFPFKQPGEMYKWREARPVIKDYSKMAWPGKIEVTPLAL